MQSLLEHRPAAPTSEYIDLSSSIWFLKLLLVALRFLINFYRPIFQKLILLNRDWSNDQEGAGYTSYKCGYYDDTTKPNGQIENLKKDTFEITDQAEFTQTAVKTRSGILESFQKTSIFAMAGPGVSSAYPKPNDTSSEYWDTKFKDCVV